MKETIHFGSYLTSIDGIRKKMERVLLLLKEARLKNKELYADNVLREKELCRLMSWPEVQKKISELKEEEDNFIKKFMAEYNTKNEFTSNR